MRRLTPWERLEARLPDGFERRWAGILLSLAFAAGIIHALGLPRGGPDPPAQDAPDAETPARQISLLDAELQVTPPVDSAPPGPVRPVPEVPREAVARPIPPPLDDIPGFDGAALVAAGLDPAEAERVRHAWLRAEASRRELEARAAAEGWTDSYRHARDRRDIDDRLRQELDDGGYDGLLFATGRPNRLVVREVMEDSPAHQAGLRPGDRILRYDGARVFSSAELHAATLGGERDDKVQLELERDGDLVTVEVQHRPLGVLAKPTRVEPRS